MLATLALEPARAFGPGISLRSLGAPLSCRTGGAGGRTVSFTGWTGVPGLARRTPGPILTVLARDAFLSLLARLAAQPPRPARSARPHVDACVAHDALRLSAGLHDPVGSH